MAVHQTQLGSSSDKKLKRSGIAGIVIGALALLACELPVILALFGLSGLSAVAMGWRPSPMMEMLAIIIVAAGFLLLVFVFIRRVIIH